MIKEVWRVFGRYDMDGRVKGLGKVGSSGTHFRD